MDLSLLKLASLPKLFAGKTDNLLVQLLRYTLVGGTAFVVDYGLLLLLAEYFGVNYIVAATVSFIAGLVTNYLISTAWVFGASKIKSKKVEFLAYALVGVVGLVFNDLLLYLIIAFCDVPLYFSKPLVAILVYCWNFFARRFMIFRS